MLALNEVENDGTLFDAYVSEVEVIADSAPARAMPINYKMQLLQEVGNRAIEDMDAGRLTERQLYELYEHMRAWGFPV